MNFRLLAPFVLTTFLAACQGSVDTETASSESIPPAPAPDGFLVPSSFELPSEGKPNDNGTIGPFCCTGVTAVVGTTSGYDAGYGYFFAWKGQAFNIGSTSFASDVRVLIAGLASAHDPTSELVKSELDFDGSEMHVGAQRSAGAGQLSYTATIEHVDLMTVEDAPFFDMSTLAVRLDVAVVP